MPDTHSHHADTGDIIRDPVCGMHVDPTAGKPTAEYRGHIYHFCCDGCRTKFQADPEAYRTAEDPVCGMTVERASAAHMSKHSGEKFYFCSSRCQTKFEGDPETYLGDRPARHVSRGLPPIGGGPGQVRKQRHRLGPCR